MSGEYNTHPTPTYWFSAKAARKYSARSYWSTAERFLFKFEICSYNALLITVGLILIHTYIQADTYRKHIDTPVQAYL
jgi:hypothetical protein